MCGFDGDERMMFYIESQWKQSIGRIRMQQGIHDPRSWAQRGGNDVLDLNLSNFGVDDTWSELQSVLLYK